MDEADEQQPSVTWVPAHPSYGNQSMWRYWHALDRERRDDDRYRCRSLLGEAGDRRVARQGLFARFAAHQWRYPRMVSSGCRGPVAHILDHSWADLLDHVPDGVATVVTIHDLIPLHFPGGLSGAQQARFRRRVERLREADRLIAVSQHTRGEIIEHLGVPEERIAVVPNGVRVDAEAVAAADPGWILDRLAKPGSGLRIGSLGSVLERKNLGIFPAALRLLTESAPTLIRAGQPLPAELADAIRALPGNGRLLELGPVSERQLEDFYAALDLLVVPSRHEGFGLPVLEAMARGVPVISAGATSLPEVGGEAALYFDPNDPQALADRMTELADPDRRAELAAAGRERAKEFSWRQCLEGCYRVYDEVLNWNQRGSSKLV